MIRYPKTLAEIEALVDAKIPNWRRNAERRTAAILQLGHYAETSSIWSEVKPVFMEIQHNKCAYCEQQLEGGAFGAIAHDLEHYRPKGNVRVWPADPSEYDFPTGDPLPDGYYHLVYHLGNYAAACKVCNTLMKSDFFPIASARIVGGAAPEDYAAESPYLIYPIGGIDENPEEIFEFVGVNAIPRQGYSTRRALITIDFFGLNRENLQFQRALTLLAVWLAFKGSELGDNDDTWYLDQLTSGRLAHTLCARSFLSLCRTDRALAASMIGAFRHIIERGQ
ncbi:MAG: hypothetical protein ABIY70_00270 [Capsulimonas sp.]|uniref:hypothetical protein n=1 Tax=Capsulimonas sp. TaxID=2494211 RepID=UPI0032661FDA